MANYRIPGPLGMNHSEQLPIDPLTRQPQRIPGPLGSHCEYQLKQKLEIELEKKEIALDICQFILDMTGIIDPTPASDGTNAIISLSRGRWIDAVISVVSIVPYVGDFAKLGKLPRYLKSIKKAIRIAQTDFHWSNALKRLFIPLKKVIDQLYELGANQLPSHASKTLNQIKREIDHFLKPASSGTTANQTVGEFIANSSKNSSPKVKQSANTSSKSKQTNIEEKPKKGVSSEKESGIIDGNGGKNANPKVVSGSGSRVEMNGHKIYDSAHSPIGSRPETQYRFSDPKHRDMSKDVYFGENVGTAFYEVRKNVKGKSLLVGDVKVDNMLDLTDPDVLKKMNINPKKLTGKVDTQRQQDKVYGYTTKISNQAYDEGYTGIIYSSSRKTTGSNSSVVLFADRYDPKAIDSIMDIPIKGK